jgi:hypothetical protein
MTRCQTEPLTVQRAVKGWARKQWLGDKGWDVSRQGKPAGVVYLTPHGLFYAAVFRSPRHYCARVPTVAAGVRWIARRTPA